MTGIASDEKTPEGHRPSGPVDRVLARIEDAAVLVAGIVVIAMMLEVTADVISRTLFNFPLPNSYEYMELGMVFAVYLGAAQVQREKGHVAIDIVINRLPPRGRAVAELCGCLTGIVLMTGIGYWGALAAWNSYVTAEYVGSVARLPVLPARLALLAGVFVLLLRLMLDTVQSARRIITPGEAPQS